jgi:hypothetical protein
MDELRGRPQMILGDIAEAPDDIIMEMMPVFIDKDGDYLIEESRVYSADRKSGEMTEVYCMNEDEEYVVHFFDGSHTVGDIAEILAINHELEREVAYQTVKTLFVALTRHVICRPLNAHDRSPDA